MINLRANPPGTYTKAYDKTSGLLNAWAFSCEVRARPAMPMIVRLSRRH
jgi:hypothetical protein